MLQPVSPVAPPAESQFQPLISTSKLDCVPCTVRKLIRRATVDAKAPTTKAIRAETGIFTRGLSYNEGAEAAEHWGVTLVPSYGNEREEMFDLVDGGHAVGLSGRCSVTVNTARATGDFRGDHTVYVHDVRHCVAGGKCVCEKQSSATAHNEYLIEDPGNSSKGYLWWSASLVYRFGEARTIDPKTGETKGINLLVGPDTERVSWRCTTKAAIRSRPRRDSTRLAGTVVGKVYRGGRTETGGDWPRRDGSSANGWIQLEYAPGKWGWGKGGAFRHA